MSTEPASPSLEVLGAGRGEPASLVGCPAASPGPLPLTVAWPPLPHLRLVSVAIPEAAVATSVFL